MTTAINGSRPQDYPSPTTLPRVHCIANSNPYIVMPDPRKKLALLFLSGT